MNTGKLNVAVYGFYIKPLIFYMFKIAMKKKMDFKTSPDQQGSVISTNSAGTDYRNIHLTLYPCPD